MKVIYVSGKYRANTEWGLMENIAHAERETIKLWKQGWAVICPHKNTAHLGGIFNNTQSEHGLWLKGDLEIVNRCDAIYMLSNWRNSDGAKEELDLAKKLGLEIYYEQEGIYE